MICVYNILTKKNQFSMLINFLLFQLLYPLKSLIPATLHHVDPMLGALRGTEQLPASVFQNILEIHMLHADLSVL